MLKHRLVELEKTVQALKLQQTSTATPTITPLSIEAHAAALSNIIRKDQPHEQKNNEQSAPSTPKTQPAGTDSHRKHSSEQSSPSKPSSQADDIPADLVTPKQPPSDSRNSSPHHTGFTPDQDTLSEMANMDIPANAPHIPTDDEFTPVIHKKTKRKANKQKRKAATSPTSSSSETESPVKHRKDHRKTMDVEHSGTSADQNSLPQPGQEEGPPPTHQE